MSAKVYPNHALRAEGENRIELSDADSNRLREAIDAALKQQKIKGLPADLGKHSANPFPR